MGDGGLGEGGVPLVLVGGGSLGLEKVPRKKQKETDWGESLYLDSLMYPFGKGGIIMEGAIRFLRAVCNRKGFEGE